MNLEYIHATVRKALARGNTLDDSIPVLVEQAARWIERNRSYRHMERFMEITTDEETNKHLKLPSKLIKTIRFIRIKVPGGYHYLDKIDPQDMSGKEMPGRPEGYFVAGEYTLVLDACYESGPIEVAWYEYTSWPRNLADSNWLIENASDALIAQTMVFFSGELLAPKLRQLYEPQRTEALRTLNLAEEEEEFSDTSMVMRFK